MSIENRIWSEVPEPKKKAWYKTLAPMSVRIKKAEANLKRRLAKKR